MGLGERYLPQPRMMNMELTTACPLRCPQCYVSLEKVREMPLQVAQRYLRDGAASGIKYVNLAGGETLAYPHLYELVRECRRLGLESAVAISGAYADRERLGRLIEAGVDEIYVSLNGSTEEVNRRTREGYQEAVRALSLLGELGFANTWLNFVMHSVNAEDLPQMAALGESFGVRGIAILAFKPNAAHELPSYPTAAQLRRAARFIKDYRGSLILAPEPCFSPLRALVGERFFGNGNVGMERGCTAGRDMIAVTAEGRLAPCRHIDMAEDFPDIKSYWRDSSLLRSLRQVEERREPPCRGCTYEKNCLPCMGTGLKLSSKLPCGWQECPLAGEAATGAMDEAGTNE